VLQIRVQFAAPIFNSLEVSMSKAALREQRRAQRIARLNRQRTIVGIILGLVVILVAFFVYRDYASRNQSSAQSNSYPIGTLDTTPPSLPANAITTASGLQYADLQAGTGTAAMIGDSVSVNYIGWLTNGTKFDSNIDRGQTYDFTLGQGRVIAGWDEGVQGMKVGGTRLLVIPPTLGYGSQAYSSIPGNSTLIFEVQLVSINQPTTPTP
jgi:FKBP-type peptidyl-prolyl cis-trans isomerase FkpA